MKKQITSLLLAVSLLVTCTGCYPLSVIDTLLKNPAVSDALSRALSDAETTPDTPVTGDSAPVQVAENPSLLGDVSVLYDTGLTPSVPTFTVADDFSNVTNADILDWWSDSSKQKLLQNGFLVTSGYSDEFFTQYENNRYSFTPNFITVDSMLHTYHLYFLYLQRQVEQENLLPLLQSLTTQMLAQSQSQAQTLSGTEWENAANRNVAYFSVAAALLDPSSATSLPEAASQELALIESASGNEFSPVMNMGEETPVYTEDYSQYIPRSYYTESEELTRYFKAMMWYGRMAFLQANEDETRSALLLNLALRDSGALEDWQEIYEVTSFFAGVSDDANYNDYIVLMENAYGSDFQLNDLVGDKDGWSKFDASLETLKPAAINSMPLYEWQDRDASTAGYRFMGQRYSLDADILQNLVYRDVEKSDDGRQRLLPDALDVPAAMGSDTALDILHSQGDTNYPNYDSQMEKVRTKIAEAPDSVWNASLYASWLNTLRPLTEAHGEGWPQYMQNDAWRTKSLVSFLGSWTELKHDTALYTKQVYGEMGGGGIPEADDRGWVETEPVVFGRLAALTQATSDGLDQMGLLDSNAKDNLAKLYELNRQLMVIAEKELRNELPTDDEFELIRGFGGQLEHFWLEAVDTGGDEFFSPSNQPAALVADVATDPNGSVLQTATDISNIYVLVNVDNSPRIAVGTVYTFYQFTQPMSQRMTDQDWWAKLGKVPNANGTFEGSSAEPVSWMNVYYTENPSDG